MSSNGEDVKDPSLTSSVGLATASSGTDAQGSSSFSGGAAAKVEVDTSAVKQDRDAAMEDSDDDKYDSDDDPVVAEFQVVLSRDMEEEAFLLRYPNLPAARVAPKFQEAKLKESNEVLEVKFDTMQAVPGMNKETHFDLGNTMADDEELAALREKRRMQFYRSERLPPSGRAYAMGLVDQAKSTIHLVPLNSIMEMKPVLQNAFTDSVSEEIIQEPKEAPAEEATATKNVDVVNFRRESARQQLETSKLTFAKMKAAENAEPWLPLKVFQMADPKSVELYNQYKPSNGGWNDRSWLDQLSDTSGGEEAEEGGEDNEVMEVDSKARRKELATRQAEAKLRLKYAQCLGPEEAFTLNATEYLEALAPQSRTAGVEVVDKGTGGAAGTTSQAGPMQGKNLEQQVRERLVRAGALLPSAVVPQSVKHQKLMLDLLPKFAHLVQGVWVVQSEEYCKRQFGEVYTGDSYSGQSSDHLKRRIAIRNVVLGLLNENEDGIKKETVTKIVKLPIADLQEAFQSVCRMDKETKHWKLNVRNDDLAKFKKQNAKLVHRQDEVLKRVMHESLLVLGLSETNALAASGASSKN